MSSARELKDLVDRMIPAAQRLGEVGEIAVYRWQDPSGARLVFSRRGSDTLDILPSFAGQPGVRLAGCEALNEDVIAGAVVDSEGEQVTSMAFELEQRRAFPKRGGWSGTAAICALAPDAEFFATADLFEASRRSLLDPNVDLDETAPAVYSERGLKWPPRMASDSFFSTGVFGPPEESTAHARLNGRVLAAETRTNGLTSQVFLWCRVQTLDFEIDLLAESIDGFVPSIGSTVAGTVFLVGSIDSLTFKRSWWRRLTRA